MPPTNVTFIMIAAASSSVAVIAAVVRRIQERQHPELRPLPAESYMRAGAIDEVALSLARGDRIAAIKAYRAAHNTALRESSVAVRDLQARAWRLAQQQLSADPANH